MTIPVLPKRSQVFMPDSFTVPEKKQCVYDISESIENHSLQSKESLSDEDQEYYDFWNHDFWCAPETPPSLNVNNGISVGESLSDFLEESFQPKDVATAATGKGSTTTKSDVSILDA